MNHSFAVLILFFLPHFANTQPRELSKSQFTKIRNLEGLKVRCILKDTYGFMWFGTETGLYRYDGYNTEVLNLNSTIHLSSELVVALFEDRQANLWIGTANGLQELSADRKSIKTYLAVSDASPIAWKGIYAIAEMHDGVIWCGSSEGYLYRCADKKSFSRIQGSSLFNYKNAPGVILYITETDDHNVWVADNTYGFQKLDQHGNILKTFSKIYAANYANKSVFLYATQENMYSYSAKENEFFPLVKNGLSTLINTPVKCVYQDKKGCQWLVTQTKLIRFDPKSKQVNDFTSQFMKSSDSLFEISCIYEDNKDQLWFGSYFGVYKLDNTDNIFNTIMLPKGAGANTFFSTRGIVGSGNGNLYIGSYSGFFEYKKNLNQFTEYKIKEKNTWTNPLARAIVSDTNNDLWLATEGNGLLNFNVKSHVFTTYIIKPLTPARTDTSAISRVHYYSLLKDTEGMLWLGGYDNLYTLDPKNGKAQLFTWDAGKKSLPPEKIMAIYQSRDQSIWLGTDYGLYRIKKDKGVVAHYTSLIENTGKQELTQNFINCIYEDSLARLWLGTLGGGINVFNPVKGLVEQVYSVRDGLADDKICAILPGAENDLWISTYNGLSHLNLKSKSIRNFYTGDGLLTNEFNQGSALAGTDNNLYFGSVNGIVFFNPKEALPPIKESQVMLTKLVQHNGKENKIEETSLAIHALQNIRLHYKDRFFTVYFVLKDYFESSNAFCQYAYKLEGITDEWQNIGSVNYIQFAGLPAGNYALSIKGKGSNGNWGKTLQIPIVVEKAFYATTAAYVFYTLVALAVIGIFYRFQIGRIRMRNQLQIEHLQREKLQELDHMKSQFFTNITHEFRTPLTLIQGPAEKILNEIGDSRAKRWATIIRRHSRQMLYLINQLLDLSRLEAGQEKAALILADIVSFTKDTAMALQSLAEEKRINLHFEATVTHLNLQFDPDKLGNALYNLIANAIKYTRESGRVTVSVTKSIVNESHEHAVISVQDTGIGIASEHLPYIFNRYYRVASAGEQVEGTGIGLALVKEFVELHEGTVEVKSTPKEGTIFIINIPVQRNLSCSPLINKPPVPPLLPYLEASIAPEQTRATPAGDLGKDSVRPLILIVEDHEGVRAYISDILSPTYQVIEAPHGVAGMQLAQDTVPDLIISDVMMPQMDGNMLCLLLKQNERTSHIPVILLTAKVGQENRIQGLQTGADVYLTKPFDERELLLHVKNMLHLRRQIAAQIMSNNTAPLTEPALAPMEKSFLERFSAIVDANLSDEEFGVENMLKQIGMSRTQLHRKIKAVTGLSTSTLIRVIRLQRGLEMLQKNELNISEITYSVGFSSPSYFAECFHKHFGYSPTEVRKKSV